MSTTYLRSEDLQLRGNKMCKERKLLVLITLCLLVPTLATRITKRPVSLYDDRYDERYVNEWEPWDDNLEVNGNVTADYFLGDGSQLTGIGAALNDTFVSKWEEWDADLNVTGLIRQGGSLLSELYCSLTGCNITGNLTVNGNITADYYFGNGSQLTGLNSSLFDDVFVNEDGDIMTGSLHMESLLNASAYGTGDILSGEIDLNVGDEHGAIEIGQLQIFRSELSVGGLNLNGTNVFRAVPNGGTSPIEFAFVTTSNLIRFVIPIEGDDYATYNPRSQMIGGDLGQAFNTDVINCTVQGYDKLDCNTDLHGADLGVQNNLQVRNNIYINNTSEVGTLTQSDSYIYLYDAAGGIIISTVWTDITFDTEVREDLIYTHDADDYNITVIEDGWYLITAECTSGSTGNTQYQSTWRLMLDTGTGFNEIAGTRAAAIHRTTVSGGNSITIHRLIELNNTDIIKFQGLGQHDTYQVTVANGCRLMVERK